MRFDLKILIQIIGMFLLTFLGVSTTFAQPTAVVPNAIIYPGQTISADMVREVEVINPNLRPGYAKVVIEVDGMVTKRTLLPGRIIPVSVLREAYIIERGKIVSLVFQSGNMLLRAQAVALQNGMMGEVIPARNIDSGITVSGIVMQDGSLRAMVQ